MRKFLLILLLGLLMAPLATYAGIYGTLKGKVVDDEGSPVIGASVRIEGTKLGAVVKADGRFTVLNLPSASYKVRVTSVGFSTYETTVRISADEVTELSIRLKQSQGTTTETLYVDASKIMVENTEIGQKRKFSSESLEGIARDGVAAIVGLSAGVFNSGNGYVVRGSRVSETQVRVDGLDVGNQFTGGLGSGGLNYTPLISQYATEEIQVLTGGFSAEYGEATGGIVNTVAKTGRTDRYEGFLRWRTDVPALFGSAKYPIKLERVGDRWQAMDDSSKSGPKALGTNIQNIDFGTGGPIPFLDRSTFYLSGVYNYTKYRGASYDLKDPHGMSISQFEDNESWVKNLVGRVKFGITNNIDVIVGGNFGMSNHSFGDWGWAYNNDLGVVDETLWGEQYKNGLERPNTTNIKEKVAKNSVMNQQVANAMVRINHRLDQNSFYEFTISNTSNNDDVSKRKGSGFDGPSYFGGFEVWEPQDIWVQSNGTMETPKDDKTREYIGDKLIDQYTPVSKSGMTSKDGYLRNIDMPLINPLTGYFEGAPSTSATQNPYGLTGMFNFHGNEAFQFRSGNYWQADGSYTKSIDGQFTHMIKTGFEFRYYTMGKYSVNMPWDSNPFYDIYTDQWGGNVYAKDIDSVFNLMSQVYHPFRGSFYVQDQISYKGIIISPGIRFDYFNPNVQYRQMDKPEFIRISERSKFADAPAKFQLSPRINITYPITERSNVSIAYGLYFQTPQLQYMYDGFSVDVIRGNQTLGDPNMEAQRTNQYQITFNQQINDYFAFDLAAYYKDMYNQVGIMYVPAVPVPFFQYTVAEYGNARGLEFTLRKRPSDHISVDLNYNLSYSISTASGPGDNYLRPVDPYTDKQAFPLNEFPTNADRRHRINFNLMFFWTNNDGPSIAGIQPIENTNISFTTIYQTGTPYTRLDLAGAMVGEYNGDRQPSFNSTDMRISKTFYMRDWFGESFKASSIEFFLSMTNLLNQRGVSSLNDRTADPLDDGINYRRPVSYFGLTPYYKEANFGRSETTTSDQYDIYGNRFYSADADFDHSNVVSQEEKWRSNSNYLETAANFRGRFQFPRTVYFGIMFRF